MDVESNNRNCDSKDPSFNASSVANDTFIRLLKKHDFDAIVEMMTLDGEKSDNRSDTMKKESYRSKSKDSTNTNREVFRADAGENLKECSVKHNISELSDHSVLNSDVNAEKYCSNISKSTVQPKFSFSSYKTHHYDRSLAYSNTDNVNNYTAECRNRVTFENEEQTQGTSKRYFPHRSYAEKTTYCRPVNNLYNKEFINKTVEKNIKLQKLLKKIVLARKREKEKEQWNNYLNELKNKHTYYSNEPRHISPQYVPHENWYPGPMYDFYNANYYWNVPRPPGNLVQHVYGYSDQPPHAFYSSNYERVCENPRLNHLYKNEQYCYPTSSQGRFMMMQKDKNCSKKLYHAQPSVIVINKDNKGNIKKAQNSPTEPRESSTLEIVDTKIDLKKSRSIIKRNSIKTKLSDMIEDCGCTPIGEINNLFKENLKPTVVGTSEQRPETTKEKYDRVTENVNRLKQKLDCVEKTMQRKSSTSLKTIETKLDALMTSLNSFMAEIKSKKSYTSPSLTPKDSIDSSGNSRESSVPPRDSSYFEKKKKSVTIVGNASHTPSGVLHSNPLANNILRHTAATTNTKINTILDEERDKSNKLRKEIEELLPSQTNRPCVQITFDIPTKDCATEVTNSLSKTKLSDKGSKVNEVIEEVMAPNRHRKMTIAVNTDPLGLLALFRISSEAIKQLMSYVDYNWYLPRLPLRQVENSGVSDYVCNICGDAFTRPSQLSDHIKRHKLGNAK